MTIDDKSSSSLQQKSQQQKQQQLFYGGYQEQKNVYDAIKRKSGLATAILPQTSTPHRFHTPHVQIPTTSNNNNSTTSSPSSAHNFMAPLRISMQQHAPKNPNASLTKTPTVSSPLIMSPQMAKLCSPKQQQQVEKSRTTPVVESSVPLATVERETKKGAEVETKAAKGAHKTTFYENLSSDSDNDEGMKMGYFF